MKLLQETQRMLTQYAISPKIILHQNFCVDEKVIDAVVAAAELKKTETVFEIGAGTGLLTKRLAEHAKKVIAVEKDERLAPLLHGLPKNVELLFADALQVLPARKDFNKIIANIPYQIAEPLLKILCTALQVERAVLMVPRKFAVHVAEHPFFSAFFDFKIVAEVPGEAFYPLPKVVSAILVVTQKKETEMDDSGFLARQLFLQKDKKLKNALREGLIAVAEKKGKKLSKKEAKKRVDELNLSEEVLEEQVGRVNLITVKEMVRKLVC